MNSRFLNTAALLVLLPLPAAAQRLEQEPDSLRPGLLVEYRSLVEPAAKLDRVEAKPASYLGHSSPHPRLPPGPFEAEWRGVIRLQEDGPLTFSAYAGGEVTVTIDGVVVLRGRGATDQTLISAKESIKREPGHYRIAVRFRSLTGVPARLQLFWEGPGFAREPVPAWRLANLAADVTPAAQRDAVAARGRALVEHYGCARCHSGALPGIGEPPPGPSLADAGRRLKRDWLLHWLADPAGVRPDARMPALFSADRAGHVERWLIAAYLLRDTRPRGDEKPAGDHRQGRMAFIGLGCFACHFVPDVDRSVQPDHGRTALTGLSDRLGADDLAAFLLNPHARYPDGRMPRQPLAPHQARDIAAYLLLWSKPSELPAADAPKPEELRDALKRLGAANAAAAALTLMARKGCVACHPGLGQSAPRDEPLKEVSRGCVSGMSGPRFELGQTQREELKAYLAVATSEKHPSPFAQRQRRLERAGCVRCHQRDSNRPPPIEEIGATHGGAFLQEVPFQRTPRLTNAHQKYTRSHLAGAVREGVTGLRTPRYTYRMPAFGADADVLVQALAEADGELPAAADPPPRVAADPTLATLTGPALVGSQGYSCISCHAWNGRHLVAADPGAAGPDLTRTAGRIRRDWFDRFLDDPQRAHPGTPMPAVFQRGQPAMLTSVLDGDPARQKEALWSYLARGKDAPEPKSAPPLPVAAPAKGEPPVVAQIPIRLPEGGVIESISILWPSADLLIYDLATFAPHSLRTGAQISRNVQGRTRQNFASGSLVHNFKPSRPESLNGEAERALVGHDGLPDGVRIRWRQGEQIVLETLRLKDRTLAQSFQTQIVPRNIKPELVSPFPREDAGHFEFKLPREQAPPPWRETPLADPGRVEGSLARPGYRAIAYPRPKTASGEDRVMPVALAAHPRDGRLFVASLKTGELFVLNDPDGSGKNARFDNFARGVFQDALSMLCDDDALYVLHRRNLTRVSLDGTRFDRVAALPHGVADTYDYAYGLARDKTGAFVFSLAPYANTSLPGSGGALRLVPGQPPQEIAYGFRNPLGWCAGPGGDIFCTDNQGEWVPANKLCHIAAGRFYGFPNPAQKQHTTKPPGRAAVWVPYGWAHSINGVTYDNSSGKFGPFAGQFFLAELMFGGAIIRADVEKVNGEYQGACFPFWGKGLMGPVSLAFDPKGRLFVGGITEPGWMAQPDRGQLFRIDYTGEVPFEMKTIRVRPRGFRIEFTRPVDPKSTADPASYRLEHFRYEITGAYGSPELDRTSVPIEHITVAPDGLSAELTTAAMVKDRVYMIEVRGVKSAKGEPLVHPVGAYTMNEVPNSDK